MRIILFSSNSKVSNKCLDNLIDRYSNEIVALVIVPQIKGNLFKQAETTIKYLRRTSFSFFFYKIYESFGGKRIIKKAKKYGINIIKAKDVNDPELIKHIKILNPDICLFCFVNQILKKPIISVAKCGSLNAHGSLLPRYRGAAQYFWYLFNKDKIGGVTIQFMDEKLDAGDIIVQKKFPIKKEDSMFSIHMKIGELSGILYSKVIEMIRKNRLKRHSQSKNNSSYHTIPTKDEMKEFKERGLKVY